MTNFNRRAILAAAAVVPALALPAAAAVTAPEALAKTPDVAVPAEPDPAFAAITAYLDADAAHGRAVDLYSEAEERFGCGNPRAEPFRDESGLACHAAGNAKRNLLRTVPTTPAGLVALLQLVKDHPVLVEAIPINRDVRSLITTSIIAVTNMATIDQTVTAVTVDPTASAMGKALARLSAVNGVLAEIDAAACNSAKSGVDLDAAVHSALDEKAEAEWKVIQAPAESIADVRRRALVMAEIIREADEDGEPRDNRHQAALEALVADIFDVRLMQRSAS